MQNINEILVIRNDKIGDFILILPALSWLKKNIPNCRITCIVSEKVLGLASQSRYIDSIIIDKSIHKLYQELKTHNFDASITFYSTFRLGYLLNKLNIIALIIE